MPHVAVQLVLDGRVLRIQSRFQQSAGPTRTCRAFLAIGQFAPSRPPYGLNAIRSGPTAPKVYQRANLLQRPQRAACPIRVQTAKNSRTALTSELPPITDMVRREETPFAFLVPQKIAFGFLEII